MLAVVCKRMQQLPIMLERGVHYAIIEFKRQYCDTLIDLQGDHG